MNKLVFSINDEKINIAYISNPHGSIRIKKSFSLNLKHEGPNYKSIGNKTNILELRNLLDGFKLKNRKIDVVMSFEEIITRIIEIPFLKSRDIDKYISNNTSEYFTVNVNEFYFDYKVVSNKKIDGQDILVILLAAVPKKRIIDIKELITGIGAQIGSINLYPDALTKVFNNTQKSCMVLDVNHARSAITIIHKGEIFIYSLLNIELENEEGLNEIQESLNYFLNFYATRHFGNKLKDIFVIGELSRNYQLIDTFKRNIEECDFYFLHDLPLKLSPEVIDSASQFIEIIGLYSGRKKRYNRLIDFSKSTEDTKLDKSPQIIVILAATFTIITLTWVLYYYINIQITMKKYNTEALNKEILSLSYVQKQINDANIENSSLKDKARMVDSIKSDDIDYIHILDVLRNGLPTDVTVKAINIKDKDNVEISFNINNSTLDVAKTVISINKLGIFENTDISNLKLDDTVKDATFSLKLKK